MTIDALDSKFAPCARGSHWTVAPKWVLNWGSYAAVMMVTIGNSLVRLDEGALFTALRKGLHLLLAAASLPFLFLVQNSTRVDNWVGEFCYPVYAGHFICVAIAVHFLGVARGGISIPVATVALAFTAVMSVFLQRMSTDLVDDLRSPVRHATAKKMPQLQAR